MAASTLLASCNGSMTGRIRNGRLTRMIVREIRTSLYSVSTQVPEVLCNNTYRYLWRLPLEQNGHRPSALGPDQKPPPPLRAFSDPPEIGNGPPGALADWIWSTLLTA
ncbi:hypothetical protein CCUS01_14625 [Colletotrichum cuscutae]|uniref:Uncharacterized protein n=1 Tax=Colletotrichum cuscutae TaxID=1209917 RepID=A0AAI9Y6J0_9PEZI|nr:hypothetical protein CCUS01_14625 [Colletotrichum cuscutae]